MARYWQWKWKRTISKGYNSTWIILLKHRYVFYLRYKAIKKKSILEFMALHCHGKVVQLQNIYQLYPKNVRNETGIQQQVKNKIYLYNENQKLSPKNQPAGIHRWREVHFHGVPNRDRLQPSRRGREAARRQ